MTQSLTYVEIDLAICSLTYGIAPCTASIPTTGDAKCFNSVKTCQDRAHFSASEVTLRFAKPAEYLPREIECIPSILSVEFSPATVSLGKNLGQRASLTITFRDHPHSDTGQGYDKYRTERAYDPYSQGTYWGKFRARQPFLRGRSLRWKIGVVGQNLPDMETRHFVIDSFDGPTPDGKYTIIAKDVLKFADGDRAQAPALSNGYLSADITAAATSATLLGRRRQCRISGIRLSQHRRQRGGIVHAVRQYSDAGAWAAWYHGERAQGAGSVPAGAALCGAGRRQHRL
ncbi:hypothetical protein ACNJYD_19805 [Bradyrhizobium sp. DASA03005]|uniref:hypothetical protein n=1 Tax=Bradyrhizobium sp. SPXBL-02 TaxID=3395912 RepID=UPI003F71E105